MIKTSKSDMVKLIKKMAQGKYGPPPAPVSGNKPTPASTAKPPAGYGPPIDSDAPPVATQPKATGFTPVFKGKNVVTMQLSMQDLGQSVILDSESQHMAKKPKDYKITPGTTEVKSFKKGFNDFIAEQYLGTLDDDKKGVEWTKDPKMTSYTDKKPTQSDIYELDVVMDTLRRVGSSTGEFKADGNWEFRTDNALKNIMGFAWGLLHLESDFYLTNKIYTEANWKSLQKLLSGYSVENGIVKLSPQQKEQRAAEITKHLKSINKLYNDFRTQVTAKPQFRPVIEGRMAFEKYTAEGSNKNLLSQQEDQYSKSDRIEIDRVNFMAGGKQFTKMPIKALTSKEEYLKWALDDLKLPNEEAAVKLFNNAIKPQIEKL